MVCKACQASGTSAENYRPRQVIMAEISVHGQEHAYLACSYKDKSQPIFTKWLSTHLRKLRPDQLLLPYKGRHDSTGLLPSSFNFIHAAKLPSFRLPTCKDKLSAFRAEIVEAKAAVCLLVLIWGAILD